MSIFITFEGIEGSGKTTQLRRLALHLRNAGRAVMETREPGGTAAGIAIRQLLLGEAPVALTPFAELLLYLADRAQHVAERIRPALEAGQVVLCDRFSDSTIAYQGFARGLDLATVRQLDTHARGGLLPDVTFLLDLDVAQGLRRARARAAAADRFETAPVDFHDRVRQGLLRLAADYPLRFQIIDSSADPDAVAERVASEVDRRLARR